MSKVKGLLVVVLAVVLTASCGGAGPTATEFDSETLNDNSTQIQNNVTSAELVFGGTITALGTAPNFWSGIARSTQGVTYTVDDVIKGSYTDSEITVYHLVVDGSRQAADHFPVGEGLPEEAWQQIQLRGGRAHLDHAPLDQELACDGKDKGE